MDGSEPVMHGGSSGEGVAVGAEAADRLSTVLDESTWRAVAEAHAARADALTAAHRARRARGEAHPVEDFLFTYYSYSPSMLRRWHPGVGVALEGAAATERAGWRWYRPTDPAGSLHVDGAAFAAEKPALLGWVRRILAATTSATPQFGCFGLHEWAMVYRQGARRHPVPLRLGQAGTDAVVEASELRCTHFDAFRFFTADAVPQNLHALTRDAQAEFEQPGCLHAGMDLYRWAVKLGPLVPGALLLDTFEFAREIRTLDMEASPYDLTEWGYEPVPIETPAGKSAYGARQRAFAERGVVLRQRLVACLP